MSRSRTELWRAAHEPVAAHALAQGYLTTARYNHTRGVAQQAARLAHLTRQQQAARRRLLAAAWLHDIGYGVGGGFHPVAGARALRSAGHEGLARIVAHHSGAAMEAALRDLPPISREFPPPVGDDGVLLTLLDIADLTTGADGERTTPARRLHSLVERRGSTSAVVRVLVSTIDRMGRDPLTRRLVEEASRAHRAAVGAA